MRVTGDNVEERDEKFLVQLGKPKRTFISDSDGIGDIKDDDYGGQVSISDISLTEGNNGQKLAKVTVSLSPTPLHEIEIRYDAKDDSAKASLKDYLTTRGSLFFKPGRLVLAIAVPVLSDTDVENDERLFVKIIASPYNSVLNIVKNLGVITIRNDDIRSPTELSITDSTRSEENGDQLPVLFTVTLAQPASRPLEISYETQDRTATAPSDYIASKGVLRFETGQDRGFISIPMVSDTVEEPDEKFALVLSAPQGLTGDTEAAGIILDDDYSGGIIIRGNTGDGDNNFIGREGNDVPQFASFRVSLSQPPLHPVRVDYFTQDGTASAGSDYIAQNESLIFSPSEYSVRSISVPIVNDVLEEADENFSLNFLVAGKVISLPSRIRVLNDDAMPSSGGSRIAFGANVFFDIPGREIYAMNSDGTGQIRLTFGGGNYPGLSANGRRIVYVVNSRVYRPEAHGGGRFVSSSALWVMNSDGSDQKLLFQPESELSLSFPRFSPDGQTIAVVVADKVFSLGSIVLLGADGTGARLLTDGVFTAPISFSPDATRIAFTAAPTSSTYQIGVVNLDGSGKTLLETGGNFEVDPNFSPDGQKIVFSPQPKGRTLHRQQRWQWCQPFVEFGTDRLCCHTGLFARWKANRV